jgi:hypothetical protein
MTNDELRQEFEALAIDAGFYVMRQGDGYLTETDYAWMGYQACNAKRQEENEALKKLVTPRAYTQALLEEYRRKEGLPTDALKLAEPLCQRINELAEEMARDKALLRECASYIRGNFASMELKLEKAGYGNDTD